MLANALLTLYRSVTRHRLYAALNILGLAVGVAVFLVLMLDVRFETSFDRWIPGAETTYRLDRIESLPGQGTHRAASVESLIGPLLKTDYPQVVGYTRVIEDDDPVTVGSVSDAEQLYFVDPDFFQVLALPLVSGSSATALADAGNIVVSERIARRYFGSTQVLGRQLTVMRNGDRLSYRVAGVLKDLPRNTHLKLDILAPLTPAFTGSLSGWSRWGSVYGATYVRFRSPAEARAVQADLRNFLDRHARGPDKLGPDPNSTYRLELTPLPAIHFEDSTTEATFQPGTDPRVVTIIGVVGVFALLIAVLNYVNLATARAGMRAREVAVRKVLGATRTTLTGQFLAEAVAVAFVAVLIGVALTELALPLVNAASGSALHLRYLGSEGVAPLLVGLTLLIGLSAGLYPALALSTFRPAPVLAASRMPGGGRLGAHVRTALVVLQFGAAIGFSICTLVLSSQARFLHDADRGFDREGLILVDSLMAKDLKPRETAVMDALRAIPGVTSITLSDREPAAPNISTTNMRRVGLSGPEPTMVAEIVGPDYFKTYGVKLVAGRAFDAAHPIDDLAGLASGQFDQRGGTTILNQSAVQTFQFASPAAAIGKTVYVNGHTPLQVIGVVHDVRFMSPRQPVGPIFYLYKSREISYAAAAVRYKGVSAHEMMGRLAAAWRKVVPDEPFVAKTADARLSDYYVPDEQRARLFTAGAILALLIGCLGLYGLASFNTARRTREIGIRKTLGATTADVIRLLVGQFLRPVLIANLIAWPLAYFAMRAWLSGFDQRIALSPVYFLAATLGALAIATVTVIGQTLHVARAEPAKALRYE